MRFAGFLYKVADQAKYKKCGQKTKSGTRQSTDSHQALDGNSQAMPIDLTNDDNGIASIFRGLTPNTSVCSSRPASSHMSLSQASTSGMFLDDHHALHASRRTSSALPEYRSPAVSTNHFLPVSITDANQRGQFNVANPDLRPDFYIVEEQPPSDNDMETLGGVRRSTVAPIRTGITLAVLAEQVADLKQQKQKPPEMLAVKYRLTFTDTGDSQDLRPPIVGVLADEIVKGDKVVKTIRSAFSRAGVPASIRIEAAEGPVEVTTQDEWNEAVRAVWLRHGDGAVVQVEIRV